jgi:NADPH-dependent curcumin reductase
VRDGSLKYKEHIVDGLENAPQAFIDMLDGKNFGKLLIRVGADGGRESPVRG